MLKPRVLLALVGIIAALLSTTSPAGAQIGEEAPDLAPGVAAWAGAPRGTISQLTSGTSSLTVSATVRDPDSAQGIQYEILLDGQVASSGTTNGARSIGGSVAFDTTLTVTPGVHRVCLRLADRTHEGRTTDCQGIVTSPPSSNSLLNTAQGVVVSPSGVVVPVTGGSTNNWQVTTPCGVSTTLRSGTFIDRAQVVIDPGHGGSETGAANRGLVEKHLNLEVTALVIDKFEELGITAMTTRSGDYRVPIRSRADIANALAADVFISIHHNGGAVRRSSTPGTEIYYSEARPESQRLAAIMFEEMTAAASQFSANWVSTVNQGASLRLRPEGDDLYGVHRFSPQIDSVLTEFLYLSNDSEAALLARPEVLEAQAQAIVDGVLRWWFEDDTGTSLGRRFTLGSTGTTGGFDRCVDPSLTSGTAGTVGLNSLSVSDVDPGQQLTVAGPARQLVPRLSLGVDPALEG